MDSLEKIASETPYPDYQIWWPIGPNFSRMMQDAIVRTWKEVHKGGDLAETAHSVRQDVARYIRVVYQRDVRPDLVDDYLTPPADFKLHSGEFDALSYAFFRSAFLLLRNKGTATAVRAFTQTVGRRFFSALADSLELDIPGTLSDQNHFTSIQETINRVGDFLVAEGYLRDSFEFTFDVTLDYQERRIDQIAGNAASALQREGRIFALYRMGYPAILPSAVYLYHTMGEAQHHSSRTIEELFSRAGCLASETPDFDPTGFPADEVIELWEIRRKPFGA